MKMSRYYYRKYKMRQSVSLHVIFAATLFVAHILKQNGDLLTHLLVRYTSPNSGNKEYPRRGCYCFEITATNATVSETDAEFSFDYTQFSEFRFKKSAPAPLPYISGDFFRAISDHFVDDYSILNGPRVVHGDIIFVKTDRLDVFAMMKNSIRNKYILITHDSDMPVPGDYEWLLDDVNLLVWFGQNIDFRHAKLYPIPIGVGNSQWEHGNISILTSVSRNLKPFRSRRTLLYVNINTDTNYAERMTARKYVEDKFAGERDVQISSDGELEWEVYMKELGDAKFVISPPGHGIDCHRTWEALIMGAIPIVKNSSIYPLYTDLPVFVVNDWSEVTLESLRLFETNLNLSKAAVPKRPKIWARYWLQRIFSIRENVTQVACVPCSK